MTEKRQILYGELTTPDNIRRGGLFRIAPGMLWILLFLTIPALSLIVISFTTRGSYGEIEWIFTLDNLRGWPAMDFLAGALII